VPRFDWNGQSRTVEYVDTFEEVRIYINGQSVATLRGRAPRVIIEVIDGQSVLDLSLLNCNDMLLEGAINGQSTAFVACQGDIAVSGPVDGNSTLVMCCSGRLQFRDKIDGTSQVIYSSPGPVSGPLVNGRSQVIWRGQPPAFKKIDGQSRVYELPSVLDFSCPWIGQYDRSYFSGIESREGASSLSDGGGRASGGSPTPDVLTEDSVTDAPDTAPTDAPEA
jgi:hypothetical protein